MLEYAAPKRTQIKEAVVRLLPEVPPHLIKGLEYWALYSIHQDIVKSGKNPDGIARKYIRGYDPAKIRADRAKEAARQAREEEKRRRRAEDEKKRMAARAKTLAAKARAQAAKQKGF